MNAADIRAKAIVALLFPFGTAVALPQQLPAPGPDAYVGIWTVSFHGKEAGVLEFFKYKNELTGSLTNMRAHIGDDQTIGMRPIPGSAPEVETTITGPSLHFVVAEPNDATVSFLMTPKGADKADLLFDRKAPNGQTMAFELTKLPPDED